MAEQVSHNVVNQLESTSDSASLVDVAKNYNNTASALNGAHPSSNQTPANLSSHPASIANDRLPAASTASETVAEPSAGNAAPLDRGSDTTNGLLLSEPVDDANVLDNSADPSVNSDTDTSRADATEQARDESQHARTNSVKKPTTFSRVSVSKNFLAKSAAPIAVTSKSGDKVATLAAASPAALRPRLVAKTAASLSNLSRTRLGTDSPSGPDASKVWNKNRPTPTMPPKQFTDEELKQQYGIHLATRLQSDDAGKGSKWADIDDDEDDWAPEAVEWMDGTKSTLNTTEHTTAPAEQVGASALPDGEAGTSKPSLVLGQKANQNFNTTRAILKPGAAVQAKQQGSATTGTTTTASAPEKQILIAKSPAPTPAKSPWATLPPVDKISPINPPVQVQTRYQPPLPSQDARAGDFSNPPAPAREIAADTFDRSWPVADGETRELFNSTSGKYEPAPDGRRNSIRHDNARRHGILRRPSHGVNAAEPPLNLHSNAQWSHRRGSSASQASSLIQRPLSTAQSTHSQGVLSTGTGNDNHPLASSQTTWNQQLPPPPSGADEQGEDPIKAQERVMREKREAARRRRQEEEAQAETEKQARLKAKLDALAGAGLSRKERQQASTDAQAAAAKATTSTQQSAPSTVDQVKPDATSAASAISEDAEKQAEVLKEAAQPHALSPDLPDATITVPSPRLTQRDQVTSSAASRSTFQSQVSGSYQTGPSSAFSSPGDRERKPQPFARSAMQNHDNFSSPWPSAGSGNVWGGKGIGNGTFESAFAPISSHHHQPLSLPPPPGMSRPATTNRISPQALGSSTTHSPTLQDAQLADHRRQLPASELDSLPDHFNPQQSRLSSLAASQGMGRQQHVPGPIGPPSRTQAQSQQPASRAEQVSAWQAAAQQMPNQYTTDANNADRLRHDDVPAEARRLTNRFVGTFKQTGSQHGLRKYERVEHTVNDDGSGTSARFGTQQSQIPSTQSSSSMDLVGRPSESNVRLPGARAPHEMTAPHQRRPAPPHLAGRSDGKKASATRADDDLPPPPETTSHPVFEGDHYRPNVRLPPPPAVVKLPPAALASQQSAPPHVLAQRSAQNFGHGGGARPIVQNEAWQARFNGLFNRTPIQTETPPSPPKTPPKPFSATPALAIASSTRAAMDVSALSGPTVSIPRLSKDDNKSVEGFTLDNSSAVTSKNMVQGMFNEELGFGSRPSIRLPRDVVRGSPNLAHINLLAVRPNQKSFSSNVDTQTGVEVSTVLFFKKLDAFFVKLPGSTKNKVVYANRGTKPHAKRTKIGPHERFPPGANKSAAPSPSDTTKTSPAQPRSGNTTSRKSSGLKTSAVSTSPEGQSSEATKSNSPAPPAKTSRKRSAHHKPAVKSAVTTEKPAAATIKTA